MTALLLLVSAQLATAPINLEMKVDGVDRRAFVYRGSTKENAPVVFVFHGFTGTAGHAAMAYQMHRAWPEATVVYPQGLEVNLLNRKGPGWQIAPRLQGDRDLKFFDALLGKVKGDYKIDSKRVYTSGMSNGAIFSYVLLSERGEAFAAGGPVGGFAPAAFEKAAAAPIMIIHGKADDLLPLNMAERSRDWAVGNNEASMKTKDWAEGFTLYPGPKGMDVVWHVHPGGHIWPKDASENLVKFFKSRKRA